MFLYFFSRKTCATGFMAPSATILHHHGFPRRSGAAPSTVNTGPRAPIFAYVGHQHVPQAWRPPIGAAQARYGFYCHRNAWYVEIRSKNHGGILPSIMAAERSNGAPGGAPVRPIPPSRAPIFEYAGHWHVYQGSAAGEIDWGSPWRRIYDRPGRYGSKPRKSFSSWLDLLLKHRWRKHTCVLKFSKTHTVPCIFCF